MQTEEQKIQELLKPRVKFIGEYPFSQYYFKLNEIIELPEFDNREWFVIIHPTHKKELGSSEPLLPLTMRESTVDLYPHLFRKLEWWQEREESEMPEYVRPKEQTETSKLQFGNYILKVAQKHKNYFRAENLFQLAHQSWHHYIPATLADYNSYISSTDKKEKV